MSWYSRRACGRIVLAVCLYPAVVCAASTDLLPRQIRELEAGGDLAKARDFLTNPERLKTLAPPIDPEDVKQHLALVESTIKLLDAATAYEEHALTPDAIAALKESLKQLSAPRDAGLAAAVNRRIGALTLAHAESQVSPAAEQAAREALTRADTWLHRGLHTRALAAYTEVQKLPAISSESKARAARGVAKASHAAFNDEPFGVLPTLFRSIDTAGTTIGGWLAALVLMIPVVGLVRIVRRLLLTKTTSLELVDSTVSASPSANRELAQQLEDVLERIRGVSESTTARLETAGASGFTDADDDDLPPPELVFVIPSVKGPDIASDLDKFVAAAPTVQVGPIGFNPQQLWAAVRRVLVRRSRVAFVGSLVTYDSSLVLRMTKEDRLGGKSIEWRASAPSDSKRARITCLVDIACQIILDAQKQQEERKEHPVTSNQKSLKAYVLGIYARSEPETSESLKIAAMYFQEALDLDADNWLARYELALTQRALKDTRRAIGHLTFLVSEAAARIPSCAEHVKTHPDFIHVVKSHLASTLAVQDHDCTDSRVSTLLDELIALETDTAGTIDEAGRLHLVMLARSAQSTRDALRVSWVRDKAAVQRKTGEARERVERHLGWLNDHESDLQRDSSASAAYELARGLVLHAFGRLEFAGGDQDNALRDLTEAVRLLPDYADVHVDLAKVHLKSKKDPRWPLRVTQLLDRALALDSQNHKARFVYARFFFAEETKDFTQAEIHLKTMPFDPVCLFMRAQIHSSRGQHAETLDLLERAIALQRQGPLFRVRLYAESLLALANDAAAKRVAERARRRLCDYDRLFEGDERKSKNYERVRKIYEDVCVLLQVRDDAKCFQDDATAPSAVAPPVAPPAPGPIDPRTIAEGDLQGT